MATSISRPVKKFTDIDLNFNAHPVTGDLITLKDEEAIKRAVRNLVLTMNFERPFHSEIGSPVKKLLFEPYDPILNSVLKQAIVDVITNFEPRVVSLDVDIVPSPDENELLVTISFLIVNTSRQITVNLILERSR